MSLARISDLQKADLEGWLAEATKISYRHEEWYATGKESGFRVPGVHASEVSGCPRKMVYSMRGEPKTNSPDPKMKRIFNVGHLSHELFQREFHRFAGASGGRITFQDEVPIDPFTNTMAHKWDIYSSCDGIFTYWSEPYGTQPPIPVLRMGLEIKSMNPEDFKKLTSPLEEHIEQAHVYMACLDLPIMWLLYFNKSNFQHTKAEGAFLVKFNPERWKILERRFERAHEHVGEGTLPDREEGFSCKICPYQDACQPLTLRNGFKPVNLQRNKL